MGLGTTFVRVPAKALAELALDLHDRLDLGENREVVELLRSRAESESPGWDRECWRLAGTLEVLSHHYGNGDLTFLRTDATAPEWQAHLDRLPPEIHDVAGCLDVTTLHPTERKALRAAFDAAEADRWSRIRSGNFALSEEELSFLFHHLDAAGLDVLLQEGDGERSWRDSLPPTRADGIEPPWVINDRTAPPLVEVRRAEAVKSAANLAGEVAVTSTKVFISAFYFALSAIIPLLGYPFMVPEFLRSGDWGASAFLLGLMAAMALLPLLLVWSKLGKRWRRGVPAVHLVGLGVGLMRFWLSPRL